MRNRVLLCLLAGAMLAAGPAASGQTDPSRLEWRFQNRMFSETISPDGRLKADQGVNLGLLREYFHRTASKPLAGDSLVVRFDRLYGIERYEVSRARVALEAAEMGASLALFASALGTTFGVWDEDTSWYVVGAAAAAGALWGGTALADEPKWRIRYKWEP